MDAFHRDILRYVAPFATWIALQSTLPTTAWAYAVRAAATAVVGIVCLKGRRTGLDFRIGNCMWGIAAGLLVWTLWVIPENYTWYRTYLCWPLGTPDAMSTEASPYDPAVCGWPLTSLKLIGSAFVIAPVEEVFFRSFLYRWLQRRDFTSVPLSRFDLSAFLWTVFLFTLEHDRPVAAALAGVVYGIAAMRKGLGCAIIAHVVTNFALGIQVICRGAWGFW